MGSPHSSQSLDEKGKRRNPQDPNTGTDGGDVQLKAESIQSDHKGYKAANEKAEADSRSLIGAPKNIVAPPKLLGVAYR